MGGFLLRLGKKEIRCFAVSLDYDAWEYSVNEQEPKPLPGKLSKITIAVENEDAS